jgi:transcriptional regulator with XRE-family HTH domain
MDMRKLVGRNFARLRREKGLTQEAIEERSGFSQQYLSGLERGKRNPSIVTLYEIAQALGVSHIELVAPEGESQQQNSVPAAEEDPNAS